MQKRTRVGGDAKRPYVICHMVPSVDGRIVTKPWPLPRARAIDELSLLIAPVADGGVGTPTLFDARGGPGPARHLKLLSVERRRGDLLWVRYRVRRRRR